MQTDLAPAVLRDDLLEFVSPQNPAGEDATLLPEWLEIREARRTADDAGGHREAKTADWHAVERMAGEALAHKSKDLRLAVWLTEAVIHIHGFAGVRDCMRLIGELLTRFWDLGLYPIVDEGEVEYRAKPLEWLGGEKMLDAIQQIPLTKRSDGGRDYSYADFADSRIIGYEKSIRNQFGDVDEERLRKREKDLAEGHVSSEMLDAAFTATRRQQLEKLWVDFEAANSELQALSTVLEERFAKDAPDLSSARSALEDCRGMLAPRLKKKREEEPDVVATGDATDSGTPAAAPAAPSSGSFGGGIATERDGPWQAAEIMIREGAVQQGLAEMTRLASSEYGRVRFLRKLTLAEICLSTGKDRLAQIILEELAKQIEEFHLDKWESAELVARVWRKLHRCYTAADADPEHSARALVLFEQLCRLDPWQALRWDD